MKLTVQKCITVTEIARSRSESPTRVFIFLISWINNYIHTDYIKTQISHKIHSPMLQQTLADVSVWMHRNTPVGNLGCNYFEKQKDVDQKQWISLVSYSLPHCCITVQQGPFLSMAFMLLYELLSYIINRTGKIFSKGHNKHKCDNAIVCHVNKTYLKYVFVIILY